MLSVLREKAVLTLVVLVVLGVGIGAAHDHALQRGAPFPIQDAVSMVVRPSALGFHATFAAIDHGIRAVRPRRSILKENAELRKEVTRLRAENVALAEAAQENIHLRAALGLSQSARMKMVPAEVISRKESTWFDTATIDRGRRAGIGKGWAVVTSSMQLVGQVLETDTFTSRIVALTEANSAVAAMVQRSRSSGVLQGQGGDYLTLSYLPKDADVKVGDIIVSSGMGQVIARGFVIGRVVKVVHSRVMGSTTALVRPSVRFDQIEQVFVVKPGQSLPQ
jgi:rod shape-determining protein MreC